MADWEDSGSQTGSRITASGGLPCGFNIVGCLRSLHEVDQAVDLHGRRT